MAIKPQHINVKTCCFLPAIFLRLDTPESNGSLPEKKPAGVGEIFSLATFCGKKGLFDDLALAL